MSFTALEKGWNKNVMGTVHWTGHLMVPMLEGALPTPQIWIHILFKSREEKEY